MKRILLYILSVLWGWGFSQGTSQYKWWNPAHHDFQVIEGQGWPNQVSSPYHRFPKKAEGKVSDAVWNLSSQSAGLMIRFRSNATEINVRYEVKSKGMSTVQKGLGMNHMPPTGVSGVDLYAVDNNGQQLWCTAKMSFADTITYKYKGLDPKDGYNEKGREYRLYLPLYNEVKWLEIGVDTSFFIHALPMREEKPIVVYGTSIAQGACASRPGMAWTAILGRKMDRPLINLGFSGSGTLEPAVTGLMGEIQAKMFILDCLPNLTEDTWARNGIKTANDLRDRILKSVHHLKMKQTNVPVLLVDHAGYTDELIDQTRKEGYIKVNQIQEEAYYQLKKEGVQDIYYLTKEEIDLQLDDMVDGTHPSDLGMMHYAQSYEGKLRSILKEPIGKSSTTIPVTQCRDRYYNWENRHQEILKMNDLDPPKTVFIANSIIHFWGGLPNAEIVREGQTWEMMLTPKGVRNYAYGWDRIENALWRVYHDELDGFMADKVLVMLGTNNLHLNPNHEIIEGLRLLINAIKTRQPKAQITLMGLLPRRYQEERVAKLNLEIARLSTELSIQYSDLGSVFLNREQKIDESLFSDGLHPNKKGYLRLRSALEPLITEQIKE